jgi:hypothetical protein
MSPERAGYVRTRARLAVVTVVVATFTSIVVPASALGSLTWARLSPSAHPAARYYAAMAYDDAHDELVLFGGYSEGLGGFLSDTWTWNGSNWHQETPAHVPPHRDAAAMAYDESSDRLILYGGYNGLGYRQDMWAWDGSDWADITPETVPPARGWTGWATDPTTGNLILYGGWNGASLGDTWSWDGDSWTPLTPSATPGGRDDFAMVSDPTRDRIVLFGGWQGGDPMGDTWTWNGSNWALASSTGPHARTDIYATYDPRLKRVVLFGGYYYDDSTESFTGYQDTWSWSGSSWSQLSPNAKPSKRDSGVMAYFPPTGRTVLFGGYDEYTEGVPDLGDTWVLNFRSAASAPSISTSASATRSFTVRWNAPGAPTSFVVQYATRVKNSAGNWVTGAWHSWKNVSGSTTSASFTGDPGQTYLFRVKANYAGGATTGFSNPVTAVVPYDDRWSGADFSSGWSHGTGGGHFLGTDTHTSGESKTLTVQTAATALSIIGDRCANCGKFKVFLDGELWTTVDSQAASTRTRQVLFSKSFGETSNHTLRVVTLGTDGRPSVVIDAISVRR